MADEQNEDELDEDEQRYADLWGMTYQDQQVLARYLVVAAIIVVATVFFLCR